MVEGSAEIPPAPRGVSPQQPESKSAHLRPGSSWLVEPYKACSRSWRSAHAGLLYLLTAFFVAGCANPGPPKPPSLHLPALVTDLTAERTGNRVLLEWTTPARTTDGLTVKGAMTAQICRETGPRSGVPAAKPAACAPVLRLTVLPGRSEVFDTLPAPLCGGSSVLLTYRIQILNRVERSAGNSTVAAFAAAGAAPPLIDALNATGSAGGVILDWTSSATRPGDQVELSRIDLSAVPAAPKNSKTAKHYPGSRSKPDGVMKPAAPPSNQTHLRCSEPPAGTVDTTATFGATYTYTAERVRPVRLGVHSLEIRSEPSSPVTIALRDTFPPRSPSGLATIAGAGGGTTAYIDLSWEPNAEPDLAGYFIYRQLVLPNGEGVPARLNRTPVTAPSYRDVAVSAGQSYIYWVTAVDASGNESAPSAKAREPVMPNQGAQRK